MIVRVGIERAVKFQWLSQTFGERSGYGNRHGLLVEYACHASMVRAVCQGLCHKLADAGGVACKTKCQYNSQH